MHQLRIIMLGAKRCRRITQCCCAEAGGLFLKRQIKSSSPLLAEEAVAHAYFTMQQKLGTQDECARKALSPFDKHPCVTRTVPSLVSPTEFFIHRPNSLKSDYYQPEANSEKPRKARNSILSQGLRLRPPRVPARIAEGGQASFLGRVPTAI